MENKKKCQMPFSISMDPYFWEDKKGPRYDLSQLSFAEIVGSKNPPIKGLFSHPQFPTPMRDLFYPTFQIYQNLIGPLEKSVIKDESNENWHKFREHCKKISQSDQKTTKCIEFKPLRPSLDIFGICDPKEIKQEAEKFGLSLDTFDLCESPNKSEQEDRKFRSNNNTTNFNEHIFDTQESKAKNELGKPRSLIPSPVSKLGQGPTDNFKSYRPKMGLLTNKLFVVKGVNQPSHAKQNDNLCSKNCAESTHVSSLLCPPRALIPGQIIPGKVCNQFMVKNDDVYGHVDDNVDDCDHDDNDVDDDNGMIIVTTI